MAGGDLGAQQLPQRRRVVDFVRLLNATETTLQQGVLASTRPDERVYLLELNRQHVVRLICVKRVCVLSLNSSFTILPFAPVLKGLAGATHGAAQPGPGRGIGAQDIAGLQLSRGRPGTHSLGTKAGIAAVQGHGRESTHR